MYREESPKQTGLALVLAVVGMLLLFSAMALFAVLDSEIWEAWTSKVVGRNENQVVDIEPQLAEYSNADHGDRLRDVMNRIRNEDVEHMAVFCDGKKIFERTDHDENEVSFNGWYVVMAGSELPEEKPVMVHNHPTYADASFSITDLKTAAQYDFQETIVVTTDYTFRLSAPEGWPTADELEEFLEQNWDRDAQVMQTEGLAVVVAYGAGEVSWYSKSLLIEKIAEEFGLIYTVERAEVVNDCMIDLEPSW